MNSMMKKKRQQQQQQRIINSILLLTITATTLLACSCWFLPIQAFTPTTGQRLSFIKPHLQQQQQLIQINTRTRTTTTLPLDTAITKTHRLYAGGFEWEDPTETLFNQGVDNPYKNPSLLVVSSSDSSNDNESSSSGSGSVGSMKIDAARLLSPRLNGSNLYFIGMMGTGKSSIAKIVAKRMGSYTFLDTDEIIEKAVGMKIPEIFEQEGEDVFRDVESQVLNTVYAYVRCVISTGGGVVCKRENWSKLQSGIVVWLDVDPTIIIKRIKGTDRPLLQTDNPLETLQSILSARKELYEQADVHITISDPNEQVDDVAERIIRDLHNYIDDNPPAWKQAKAKAKAEGLDWLQ